MKIPTWDVWAKGANRCSVPWDSTGKPAWRCCRDSRPRRSWSRRWACSIPKAPRRRPPERRSSAVRTADRNRHRGICHGKVRRTHRGGGNGLIVAAVAGERRFLDRLGAGIPRLHPALRPLHRHGGGHRSRSRVEMGRGIGHLQHGAGVVHGVDCLPYRFDILSNGLAGLYRMGHRDRCGGSRSSAALAARVRQAARGLCIVPLGTMSA